MPEVLYNVSFSFEKELDLKRYLKRRILGFKQSFKSLYEEKILRFRSAYQADPAEEIRQFPFQNASNLIIPLIAIHTDTLHAQIMAAIFRTSPLVYAKILAEQGTQSDEMKTAYEEFMNYVGVEPEELDLYRVYNEGFRECIKYGMITFKSPWEVRTRDFLIPGGDGTGGSKDFLTKTLYVGPRPEKLPFTSFYFPIMSKRIEDMDMKCHKRTMTEDELLERKWTDIYERDKVDGILQLYDRVVGTVEQKEKEESVGIQSPSSFGHREWDVWECFFSWRHDGGSDAPRFVVSYHEKSDTILRVKYDNFEKEWFVGARMASRDDQYPGYGFAEILWMFQEGASETYNGYRDNQTVANTRVWRVHPDSKLHQGYRIYPSAMLPADKDEIEALAHGDVSTINLDELRLLLELAERRSGVSPPQQGMGAGQFGKRGVYNSMGTLAVMQEGNSRKDLNVSDMRDRHIRLARLFSYQYAVLGKGNKFHEERMGLFGSKAKLIENALDAIASRKIGLPCYSATASLNKEVEKQNDVMLSQIMTRHYQMIATLLGSMQSMMTPPEVKEYFAEVVVASNILMKRILKNFGHDDADRLVPDPMKGKPNANSNGQPPQPPGLPTPPGSTRGVPQTGALPPRGGGPPMAGGTGGPGVQ